MSQSQNPNESTPNTELMMSKLKEDVFPDMPDEGYIDRDVRAFFDDLFVEVGLKKSDVIQRANIDRTYGYQLLGGVRIAQRDYYLRIALAMELDLRTTQRMLAVVRRSALHPLIKRDAALIFAINHEYDLEKVHDFLGELGLPPLEEEMD